VHDFLPQLLFYDDGTRLAWKALPIDRPEILYHKKVAIDHRDLGGDLDGVTRMVVE
jgi:hypothetical protein